MMKRPLRPGDTTGLLLLAGPDPKRGFCRVYVLHEPARGYKVGTAHISCLQSRVRAHQAQSLYDLTFVRHCRGGHTTETAIHQFIGPDYLTFGREWFHPAALPAILVATGLVGDVDEVGIPVREFPAPLERIDRIARSQLYNPFVRYRQSL